ncbi:MAG: hypothetical protein GY756_20795 [bacterium]|nr:hypothetical protein [bacterium]
MKKMNKHILILLFCLSSMFCNSQINQDSNSNKSDNKFYQYNFDLLSKDIEKKFIIKNKNKIDTAINILIKINDSLFSRTSSILGTPTSRTTVFKKDDDYYIEVEKLMFYNNSIGKLTIIKPKFLPYNSSIKTIKSKFKYPTNLIYDVYNESVSTYIGESDFIFKNDSLRCIVYKYEILITKTDIENNKETRQKKIGKIYYGEGIGPVYSEIINKSDTITWTLIDVNELEKNK